MSIFFEKNLKKLLQSRFYVLYLRYFHYTLYNMQRYLERLISKSKRGGCARESVEIANKLFFCLSRGNIYV